MVVEVRFTFVLVRVPVFGFDFERDVLVVTGKTIKTAYCPALIFSLALLSTKLSRTWLQSRSLEISVYSWIW